MLNKYTTKVEKKNNVYTPEDMEKAFNNLPFNYIVKVQKILEKQVESGMLQKSYSKQYIIDVRKQNAFNEDILNCLIEVGLEHYNKKAQFGFVNKKTPSTS